MNDKTTRSVTNKTKFAALVILALGLAGCITVGPDYEQPDLQVDEDWINEGDERVSDAETVDPLWWRILADPILDELIDIAYRQNLTLKVAGLRILEARAQLGIAVGNLYPQQQRVTADAFAFENSENTAGGGDPSFTSYSLGFDATWEADFWGKFRRGIESADASFLASIADYDDFLVTLVSEVARTYAVMRTLEERMAIAQSNVETQQRSADIVQARFDAGATTELDLQQARTLLFTTQSTVPALRTGIRQARNALAVLLGITPGLVDQIVGAPGVLPSAPEEAIVGIPAELLRRRPDVRFAELSAVSQAALVGVAQADLYPSIALFGTVGLAANGSTETASGSSELFSSDAVFFQGGPTLSWPVFNYGRIKNQVRVQDARLQQLLVNYQNVVLEAAREAEDNIAGFVNAWEQTGYLASSVESAKRSEELALLQYREGTADYTRVLNSQEALLFQQDSLITARGDVIANFIGLYKALGGGWEMREGQDFVAEDTRREMRERTNWGGLLTDEEDPLVPAELDPSLRQTFR